MSGKGTSRRYQRCCSVIKPRKGEGKKGGSGAVLAGVAEKVLWRYHARGNYAYVCARVKARKTRLLPKEEYQRLFMMDLPDIARFLQERKYDVKSPDFVSLEEALQKGLEDSLRSTLSFSKGNVRDIVSEYMKRFDVFNVKTILRGKYSSSSLDEIRESFTMKANLGKALLEEAARKATLEEAVEHLRKTEYYAVIWEALGKRKRKDLFDVENALDRFYYQNLVKAIVGKSRAHLMLLEFLREEIDVLNLDTLLKLRKEGASLEKEMFVEGGKLSVHDLMALSKKDYAEIMADLKKRFGDAIKDDPADTTRALEKRLIKSAETFSHLYPLSILPIIHYILAKESEITNLRIIAGGKESGLSREAMESMMYG